MKFKFFSYLIIFILLFSFSVSIVLANESEDKTKTNPSTQTVSLDNPLGSKTTKGGTTDIPTLIGYLINAVLGVVGSLALAMFIYGGFTWMTSSGNAEQVTKGKNIIIWAVLGLVIIFSAYALVNFVIGGFASVA